MHERGWLGEPLEKKKKKKNKQKKTCHDFAGIESRGCDVSLVIVRQREHAEEEDSRFLVA